MKTRKVIIAQGTEAFPRHDTASIAELSDGKLMAVWHRYEAGPHGGEDCGLCHICGAESIDRGMSWSEPRTLIRAEQDECNVQAPALRLLPDGRLLLICLRTRNDFTESSLSLLQSTDHGQTFQPIGNVWPFVNGKYWLQGGASSLILLSNGRLLVPCHGGSGRQWGQHNLARCLFSDDEGKNWQVSSEIDLPKRGAMEPSVAELPNGKLVMSLRNQLGKVHFSFSSDYGTSWSEAIASSLQASEACTCLRRIPGTSRLLLLWNDTPYDPTHHHFGLRTPLSAAVSDDGGRRWERLGELVSAENTDFTNIGCDFLSDGKALVTYMVNYPSFARDRLHLHSLILDTI